MMVQLPRVSKELEITYKEVQQLQNEINTGLNEAENVMNFDNFVLLATSKPDPCYFKVI